MEIDKLAEEIYISTKENVGIQDEDRVYDLKTIKEIVEPIIKLIQEAKGEKKYIYIEHINLWINPEEFEKKLRNGWYVYHISLLKLRNPEELIEELEKEILDKRKEVKKALKEIASYLEVDEKELEIFALKKVMIKEKIKDSETLKSDLKEE